MTAKYAVVKEWRKKNPEKVAEQDRRYRAKHPETHKRASKKYREIHSERLKEIWKLAARARRKADPEGARERSKRYLARQEQKRVAIAGRPRPEICEICRETSDIRICFDHDHQSGEFRGWICDRCNKVLGMVKDSPTLLHKLQMYLNGVRVMAA